MTRIVRWKYIKDGKKFTDERRIRKYIGKEHAQTEGIFLGRVGNGGGKMFIKVADEKDAERACKMITPYPIETVKIVEVEEEK
jgi:hypothetical protein